VALAPTTICNQIIEHFLFHFRPDGVSEHKDILNLGLWACIIVVGFPSNTAVKASKVFFCLRKVCGLFPVLLAPDVFSIGKKVGHCVGHNCWMILLLVVVKKKERL